MGRKSKYGPEVTERIVELKEVEHLKWREIHATITAEGVEIKYETMRSRYRNLKTRTTAPTCDLVQGATPEDYEGPSFEDTLKRADDVYQATHALETKRSNQLLEFSHGPVAIAWVADQHFGDEGTDHVRAVEEAKIIASTPGMYVGFVDDGINNFIVGKLQRERHTASMSVQEEWILLKGYLEILAPKLKIVVGGNHESWPRSLTGIDPLRGVVKQLVDNQTLYAKNDCSAVVRVGNVEFPGRARHKWRGSSIYNATHGIERAVKFDRRIRWGVGAHDHASGLVRQFNVEGQTGIAGMCGSYKRYDSYADTLGFPQANDSVAIVLVFDEVTNSITGFNNLEMARYFMQNVYKS